MLHLSSQRVVLVDFRHPHVRQQIRSYQWRVRQALHGRVEVAGVPDVNQPASSSHWRLPRRIAPPVQRTTPVVGDSPFAFLRVPVSPDCSGHALRSRIQAASVPGDPSHRRWKGPSAAAAASGLGSAGGCNCTCLSPHGWRVWG